MTISEIPIPDKVRSGAWFREYGAAQLLPMLSPACDVEFERMPACRQIALKSALHDKQKVPGTVLRSMRVGCRGEVAAEVRGKAP